MCGQYIHLKIISFFKMILLCLTVKLIYKISYTSKRHNTMCICTYVCMYVFLKLKMIFYISIFNYNSFLKTFSLTVNPTYKNLYYLCEERVNFSSFPVSLKFPLTCFLFFFLVCIHCTKPWVYLTCSCCERLLLV